ncbi:MAG TPA: hypothetical protein VN725_01300 [Rhodanobacteraceae bacterium]|nr:hypothetical protein [Rhodanobacteraceae bacterium]
MGIITDFVIALDSDAEAIGQSASPADQWPTVQAKGVETVKLASLYCVAIGTPYGKQIQRSFSLVGGDKDEGPWVFQFPSEVLHAIASIDDARLPSVAKEWAATEELRRDGWAEGNATSFIVQLRAHAQQAIAGGLSMFLRLSL